MADNLLVYVFGDQTYDIGGLLSKLLHTYSDPILSEFLERSCQALKDEVAELRPSQRVLCPRFSKLQHLLPLWRANTLNPALSQALFCICQIGTFIKELSESQRPFPTRENACLTGRCTGLLSATAVSSSSNPSTLLFLGVHTVAVAFRVGACAWDTGSRFWLGQGEADPYHSWTVALAGADEETLAQAIERFATENVLPKASTPYISARLSPTQYSISGPPDVLNSLLSATSLALASHRLPITAPYHAGHLYCDEDVDSVLSGLPNGAAGVDFPTSQIPVISSTTGEILLPAPFPEALRKAVQECLQTPIHWDLVARGVLSHVRSFLRDGDFAVRYVAMTPDNLEPSTRKLLGQSGLEAIHHSVEMPKPYIPINPHLAPETRAKIAITGMSGRFPQAQSMEALWQVLVQGVDTHELVPSTRWNSRSHVSNMTSSMPKNVSGTGFGCWLHDAAQFDARFFNMSPREAPQVDPAQRIALMAATEALEQAGIVPGRTPSTEKDRIGVYIGSTSNDWMETNSAQNIDTYFIPGGNRAFIPGRINYHFKFSGPSYTIDTACSSSFAAIHLACNALWKGEVDTAIVGGTNILTNPDMTAGLDRGHFLSKTGNCKTFDDSADGYCRGEGVGLAVLRRLNDALADNDPIQACILSIGTNHSAEAESITRPHVGAQHALFENVLADAGVDPTSITYCEMHGTGTQAGDAGETASVLDALAPKYPPAAVRKAHQPLYIGAAKSNIGHGEAAAGVTSLAKVLLMLKASTIPPHCGIKTKINHKLPDLQARHTFIAREPMHWPRPEHGARQVLLNNFSAAGGNTALVLEDGPEVALPSSPDARSHHVVAVSAKTPASLENNVKNLISWIDRRSDATNLTLSKLSYTTTARRMHHPHRVMVSGPDLRSISKSLGQCLEGNEGKTRAIGMPKFVFTFTGQGAQFDGMGVEFYSKFYDFKADIQCYDRICLQLGFPSIRGLFESHTSVQDSVNPIVLQLGSVCFQMALSRMWISFGIQPSVVVGHSLGEYAALHTAGVLSQVDVISLVGRRAQLLEQTCERDSYGMLAIRSSATGLETLLGTPGKNYEVSCLNTREGTIIGGTKAQMSAVRPLLKRKGLSHTFLNVPYAYHTSQVDPILASLESIAHSTTFGRPTIPVISPALGKVVHEREDIGVDFVARHCKATVNMLDALTIAKNSGILTEKMIGIEIGPASVVANMVKDSVGGAFRALASCRKGEDSWKLLTQVLSSAYTAGADIDWMAYHKSFASCQQCLSLPAYSWDLKEYWIQYVHDWSLRKGDPPARTNHQLLPTTTIHTIVKDALSLNGGELVVEANLSREDLNPMVQGHKVYGVPLCTPSVYADIALTIGEYMMQILGLDTSSFAAEVADMTIQSALVANSSNNREQLLRTSAQFDATERSATCTFSSVDDTGQVTEQHSHCLVRLFDVTQTREALGVAAFSARSRIASLKNRVGSSGNTFRFSRAMIYKMVGQLADFDPKYRGLAEIILDNDVLEATGSVSFGNMPQVGTFHTNPAYIDALSQLGGFVMNGNENVDLDKELFVNHGWESLQLFESIDPATTYFTHVQMREGKDKLWTGDIVIFDADKVVGSIRGVALQGVPKRLMQYIVKSANNRVSGPAPAGSGLRHPVQETIETSTVRTLTTTKPAERPTDLQQRPQTSMVESAMQILVQESGISGNELTDRTHFVDIGIDSLLSIVISSRIREELGVDLDLSSLLELDTISSFKHHLQEISGHTPGPVNTVQNPSSVVSMIRSDLRIDTAHVAATWNSALSVIAEESGVSITDLNGDIRFADIGVDSLLSLVIGSRLRDELGIETSNMLFCLQFPTVGELESHIAGSRQDGVEGNDGSDTSSDHSARVSPLSPIVDHASSPNSEVSKVSSSSSIASELATPDRVKPAWSLSLQGSSSRATKRLFLFPDGCGVATSYLSLPKLSPSVAVVGFNSPFLRSSEGVSSQDLPAVLSSYCEALRKHQPHGPYHLGGWSAGGILAYAVAQQLMAGGEQIASLTLIDSPAPTHGLDRLPRRFFDHCAKVGIFGTELGLISGGEGSSQKSIELPEWLMSHFEGTIELLHEYCATPMSATGNRPQKVRIIWAGGCAFDGDKYPYLPGPDARDADTEGMKFLTERRTDFGPGEWAQLFPGSDIKVDVIEGEHHFSMMRGRGAEMLGELIRQDMGVAE